MATAPPDQPPSTDERIGEEVDPFSMQGNVICVGRFCKMYENEFIYSA